MSLDDRFKSLLAGQVLWSIAAKLLKAELSQIVFHYANLTRKPAGTWPAIAWHRDNENTYFCPEDDHFLRLLIPLQGMSKINGGTGIVASSHVNACHIIATDENQVIYPAVSAGSVLAIHPSLLHGGQPNRSHLERDVIIMQFGVQGSSLRHQEALELGALKTWQDFKL